MGWQFGKVFLPQISQIFANFLGMFLVFILIVSASLVENGSCISTALDVTKILGLNILTDAKERCIRLTVEGKVFYR